ncbi:NACHT domain-containing protein [Pseudomonas monsensis]
MESESYFPRYLRVQRDDTQDQKIDEQALIELPGPKVVLGEPGMGKSELIREIGRRLNIKPVTATHFMNHPNPQKLIRTGKLVLIDGLDEAMARREGDALDLILAKLEDTDAPDFILCCRAREWQSRHESSIRSIYDMAPEVLVLEALSWREAEAFLQRRHPSVDAWQVLRHLDAHGVGDLYANPLTLGLIGRVAESDQALPQTRGQLFESVCRLIWSEHDADRQQFALGAMSEERALSAAGALCAGMLLSGASAISLAGPLQLAAGDIRLAELVALPGAEKGREILSSKLFQSIENDRVTPIHRVIAEYLGARWLALVTKTSQAQRRLLKQMSGSGHVPSSLRGLHAWIAYHSVPMANPVITADPSAVLRYGDASDMTFEQVECMWDALNKLAPDDPVFPVRERGRGAASGLMHPKMKNKIQDLIVSAEGNRQLRFLLIESLAETPMAGELADTLEAITFSVDQEHRERMAASIALMPHRDRTWWQASIPRLVGQNDEDSVRLARDIMVRIECDVEDEVLVSTLVSNMHLSPSVIPKFPRNMTLDLFHHRRFAQSLPIGRLDNLLDLLSDFATAFVGHDHKEPTQLADLMSVMIRRSITERTLDAISVPVLRRWYEAVQHLLEWVSRDDHSLRHGIYAQLRERKSSLPHVDAELEAFIEELENPEGYSNLLEEECWPEEDEEHRLRVHEQARERFTKEKTLLRAGELHVVSRPAMAYLGCGDTSLFPLREALGNELTDDALAGFEAVLFRDDLPSPADVAKDLVDGKVADACYPIIAGLLERQRCDRSIEDLPTDTRTVGLLLCLDGSLRLTSEQGDALFETLFRSLRLDEPGLEAIAKLWLEPALEAGHEHISGLHRFLYDDCWASVNVRLVQQWLMALATVHNVIEVELVEFLARSDKLSILTSISQHRSQAPFRDEEQRLNWLAVDVLARFEFAKEHLPRIGIQHPEFIWNLRQCFEGDLRGPVAQASVQQAQWMIEQFRGSWPFTIWRGEDMESQERFNAALFLRTQIDVLANDTTAQASDAFDALIANGTDEYTDLLRQRAAQQRRARSEKEFVPLSPKSLKELLSEGPPSNAEDLKSLVMEELAVAQKVLLGDELDQVRDFWADNGDPFDENRCRDRLAALIKPVLERYGVRQLTEADMPHSKRVDLAFACGDLQLPMEVKGQWHPQVWDAATRQLDQQYLIDWRSDDRGIYCVLWFGEVPRNTGRRLQAHPLGATPPASAEEMKTLLISGIPEQRRSQIDVVVLDLTGTKKIRLKTEGKGRQKKATAK